MKIEQELVARIFLHKVAIVKSAIANAYILREKKMGGLMLAEPCLEQNALEFADNQVQCILFAGELDEAYDEAWKVIGEHMPDDFCIM